MLRADHSGLSAADALQAHAERAGLALACAYSSSDEFNAALIAERRAAGIYGPRRLRRRMATIGGVAAGLAVIVFVIGFFA
ncbi:MAG: hypothetical protein ACK4UO_04185 [Pseudolabrys sp.]